jgi:hypothetical protein
VQESWIHANLDRTICVCPRLQIEVRQCHVQGVGEPRREPCGISVTTSTIERNFLATKIIKIELRIERGIIKRLDYLNYIFKKM